MLLELFYDEQRPLPKVLFSASNASQNVFWSCRASPGFTPLYQLCLGGILQFLFIFVLAIVSISLKKGKLSIMTQIEVLKLVVESDVCVCDSPICFEILEEAHITKCGHTFCLKCITKSLEQSNRCPKCNFVIEKMDQIFPNFVLNDLVVKHKQKMAAQSVKLNSMGHPSELRDLVIRESDSLELPDLTYLLDLLSHKRQQLETDCRVTHLQLLKEFLCQVTKHKEEVSGFNNVSHNTKQNYLQQMERLQHEVSVLHHDVSSVKINSEDVWSDTAGQDGFNGSKHRKRMHAQFDDLELCYMNTRAKELNPSFKGPNLRLLRLIVESYHCRMCVAGDISPEGLEEFTESLSKFIRYSSFRTLATLSYAVTSLTTPALSPGTLSLCLSAQTMLTTASVFSIEFDKDNEYFAIAGVTKKIKVFEYGTVINDTVDIHYPVIELICNSKISSISYSNYHKGLLASSDYEGSVTVWDSFSGKKIHVFQEHEKRCWSVDFNKVDTKLIASGSDDAKVKLWSTTQDNSITSLEAKANVCCVKFSPNSRYHLTFGSAGKQSPTSSFSTQRRLFQRRFLSPIPYPGQLTWLSSSTDSQLKLWNVNESSCIRSFNGHTNEKNFVGLSTDANYIACGSENNALYIYYKGLSKQLLTYKFDTIRNVLEKDRKEEDINEFVSAVCWRNGTNVVVAANSQGTIKKY
ncbi:RFWD2 [Cordylochernes scorpioides]|uniref:RFWD2 n=1 Tax=Cordylochernes scorpioides TaxID=51811 RepID=A0ABY6L439_9ARAC|nr:RFWD2 [Cordylochernes scorpioides]